MMQLERLLYISQQTPNASHADNILAACEAGCRWIQLRVKNEDATDTAYQAMEICKSYGAVLTINDHPSIAKAVGAQGVHVGLQDMPVAEARTIVGPDVIVGGTANTLKTPSPMRQPARTILATGHCALPQRKKSSVPSSAW